METNGHVILGFIALLSFFFLASCQDQDFCVADIASKVFVNGFTCKDPANVTASDFSNSGLHLAGNTSNPLGVAVTPSFVFQLPALNTLGISVVRLDFAPHGLNPPHTHPRATEVLTLLEGTLEVGFVTSTVPGGNRLISKTIVAGDVFVFPVGLVHFQKNLRKTPAVALSALNSPNPGVISVGSTVFKSNPRISSKVLKKAFQIDEKVLKSLIGY